MSNDTAKTMLQQTGAAKPPVSGHLLMASQDKVAAGISGFRQGRRTFEVLLSPADRGEVEPAQYSPRGWRQPDVWGESTRRKPRRWGAAHAKESGDLLSAGEPKLLMLTP